MALYIFYLVLNLPGPTVELVNFVHKLLQDQWKEMDFYLFCITEGMVFLYSSVQSLSTYFTQDDPKATVISGSG